MADDLHQIAARVNSGQYPGLLSCSVESEDPPVLVYTFGSAEDARRFKAGRDVQSTGFLYMIYPTRQTVVFEERAPDPVDAEWQRLIEEHDAARAAYNDGFAAVNRRFVAVAQGSRQNPTVGQLDTIERAWERWQDVQRRIKQFVKKHAAS